MSSRHECISRPDQQVESLMSMYQGYDYVADEDGSASEMSFASECISQPDQQSESLDSFRPVRGNVVWGIQERNISLEVLATHLSRWMTVWFARAWDMKITQILKLYENDDEAGSSSAQGESAMRLRCGGMTSERSTACADMPKRQHNKRHSWCDYGYRRAVSTDT